MRGLEGPRPRSVLLPQVGLLDRAVESKGVWWKGTRRVLTAEGSLAWVRVRVRVRARARVRVRVRARVGV